MDDNEKTDDESVTIDVQFDGKTWKVNAQFRLACLLSVAVAVAAYLGL
jgi:hypothetical protein